MLERNAYIDEEERLRFNVPVALKEQQKLLAAGIISLG